VLELTPFKKYQMKRLVFLVVLCGIWLLGCRTAVEVPPNSSPIAAIESPTQSVAPSVTVEQAPAATVAPTPARLTLDDRKATRAAGATLAASSAAAPQGSAEEAAATREPIATDEPRVAATEQATGSGAGVAVAAGAAIPLTDMGDQTYYGLEGGLYPGGSNDMPLAHAEEGLLRARAVQPLAADGTPDPNGEIVLLSVGMSNTMMEFCGPYTDNIHCEPYSFAGKSAVDPAVNHSTLTIINGARGAQVADRWTSPDVRNFDNIRDRSLIPLGLSENQVQVVWLKVTNYLEGNDSLPSPNAHAYKLTAAMGDIVRSLKVRYPNLQQIFLSSRIYAGYATRDTNPEPYAYESGFSVKWLIEAQIDQMETGEIDPLAGDLNTESAAPWLAWGPYMWADGTVPRSDNLVWLPEDFQEEDGTHPSERGREKVAQLLLDFFKASPFTRCWFQVPGEAECPTDAHEAVVTIPFVIAESPAVAGTPTIEPTGLPGTATPQPPTATPGPSPTPSVFEGATPLIDMGSGTYLGFEGRLYPSGNEMPAAHYAEGLRRANLIQPLDTNGNPSPNGKIVMMSVGMSNTSMEYCQALGIGNPTDGVTCKPESFVGLALPDPAVDHDTLVLLNGARGGMDADTWDSPSEENYDAIVDLLTPLGLSEKQVQVIWLKVANGAVGGSPSLPSNQADAYVLMDTMADIVRALEVRYPNLQQVYIASRIYAGYTTAPINPEPYAYESGFAVKWLIEAQIDQMATGQVDPLLGDLNYGTAAPWLAWGPYLWADGPNPRSDGLVWLPEDYGDDMTHPSVIGREKVGGILLDFFKTSGLTRCWFLVDGVCS
jgi:hypothetical protein